MASTIAALRALLALDNSDYLDGLTGSQTAADSFGTKLSNVGGAVVLGTLSAAAVAITAVGAAAWDAGNTLDEAMDTIATATGATGPELAALRKDFEGVFTSVPTDAASASEALSILNSRLDITGPALQNLAEPLLEASRLLGGDVTANAEGFTRVMGDWVLPVEDAASSLDTLFVAAQQTGAPLDQLMERVVQYGAPMRNFGFSFEQSAALLAKWESEGVNVGTVMGGMRIAQGKFITQGKDMNTGLWETVDAIRNATDAEGLKIAADIFGAKAVGDMFDTIKSGKFDIDDLTSAMMNADGAIMDTAASTMDWGEKWSMFKNKVTVALAPIGEKMMAGVGTAMDSVVAIFERPDVQAGISNFVVMIGGLINQAVAYIPVLIEGFLSFITFLQNNQGIVIGILAALGVAALAWGVTTAVAAWTAMVPLLPVIAVIALIAAAAYLLYEAWTNNWGGIQEKVAAVWAVVQPVLQKLWDWLQVAIPAAIQYLTNAWTNTILPALTAFWQFLQANLFPQLSAMANLISAVLSVAFTALAGIWQNVVLPNLQKLWSWFQEKILPVLQTVASWLKEKLSPAFDGLSKTIGKVVDWINSLAEKLRNMKLPDWMTPGSPTPWELGLRGVADALQQLSRSNLPTFQAALQLQAEPLLASGSIDLQSREAGSSADAGAGAGMSGDAMLLEEIRRMLRDLPNTIARSVAVEREKRA
jgi:TP901 family phage tail tape measure protein